MKRRKDAFSMNLKIEKVSVAFVDTLVIWDLYESGKYWCSVYQAHQEISKINSVAAQLSTVKEQIDI